MCGYNQLCLSTSQWKLFSSCCIASMPLFILTGHLRAEVAHTTFQNFFPFSGFRAFEWRYPHNAIHITLCTCAKLIKAFVLTRYSDNNYLRLDHQTVCWLNLNIANHPAASYNSFSANSKWRSFHPQFAAFSGGFLPSKFAKHLQRKVTLFYTELSYTSHIAFPPNAGLSLYSSVFNYRTELVS